MRRLLIAAMLGLAMLTGAASAAPSGRGISAPGTTLLVPAQYRRHYAPPRAYGRRYYRPPPRRYERRYLAPRARYAPPPRYYRR